MCLFGHMGGIGWGREFEVIGEGFLGKSVYGVCVKESGEKKRVEVGGDPVGSTDAEMILWAPQILRCQGIASLHQLGM